LHCHRGGGRLGERGYRALGYRSLETVPRRGRVVPELARFGMQTWHELLVKPYRIVYRVSGDTVTVLALFDGRRDLEDVLLERLLRSS